MDKYARMIDEQPIYRGQLRSAEIALEALQLIRQHMMEGVILSRVDVARAERGWGKVQSPRTSSGS